MSIKKPPTIPKSLQSTSEIPSNVNKVSNKIMKDVASQRAKSNEGRTKEEARTAGNA